MHAQAARKCVQSCYLDAQNPKIVFTILRNFLITSASVTYQLGLGGHEMQWCAMSVIAEETCNVRALHGWLRGGGRVLTCCDASVLAGSREGKGCGAGAAALTGADTGTTAGFLWEYQERKW